MNGVHETSERLYSLRHVAAQHRGLLRRVERLRNLLQTPVDDHCLSERFLDLQTGLEVLRRLVEVHFVEETEGGYVEEAVSRVPRLAAQADALEAEHPHLLATLTALVDSAHAAGPSPEEWRTLSVKFGELACRLLTHEAAENRLLQDGFNADPALFE